MNERIINELNFIKYLNEYKRGVVISEQKKKLNEEQIWDIANGILDASSWGGTREQDFANNLRKINNFQHLQSLNKYFSEKGQMSLEERIYDEFDPKNKDDQYWLKKFDEHFASKGMSTNFLGGKQGKIENPELKTVDYDKPPQPPKESYAEYSQNAESKDGWDDLVSFYDATKNKEEIDGISYESITINDGNKILKLFNDGSIYGGTRSKPQGTWSWENESPVLDLKYTPTKLKQTIGYVSGDSEDVDCANEFCENKKIANIGAEGYCVKLIQHYLLGSYVSEGIQLTNDVEGCREDPQLCDGIFGSETKKAVIAFQKDNFLDDQSGVVGCETWGYLSE